MSRRAAFVAGNGAAYGPKGDNPRPAEGRKVTRPKKPKYERCSSKPDAAPSEKKACSLNMSRPGFVQMDPPDMELVRTFLAEGEKFFGVFTCELCGRIWIRYTRVGSWGRREFRWTQAWYPRKEEQ